MRRSAQISSAISALLLMTSACSQAGPGDKAASGSGDPVHATTNQAKSETAIKSVDEAFRAMREIRAARLAIFDGSTDVAANLVDAAASDMTKAKTADANAMPATAKAGMASDLVPFDVWMNLGEDYVMTPAKQQTVAKANEHLAKGERQKAVETLRLANINILTTAALVPTDMAVKQLGEASQLLKAGKFYDANLALKAIEDGIIIRAFDIDGVPNAAPAKAAAAAMPGSTPAPAAAPAR